MIPGSILPPREACSCQIDCNTELPQSQRSLLQRATIPKNNELKTASRVSRHCLREAVSTAGGSSGGATGAMGGSSGGGAAGTTNFCPQTGHETVIPHQSS